MGGPVASRVEIAQVLAWPRRHSLPLTSLAEPVVARHALHAITLRLDGGRAAAATITGKRAVFHNALGYAAGLGLAPGYVRQAGWQSISWLKDVAAKAPSLAEVVAAGTPGRDTLTILTLLRDAVHEAGLPALAVAGLPGRPGETLAGLPRGDSARILAAFNRRGARGLGAARAPARKAARRAGVLPGRLLPAVIELLNELMTGTPAETLSGVSLKD